MKLALSDLSCVDSFRSGGNDHPRFLATAARLGFDGVDLFTSHFPRMEASYLTTVRERCAELGLEITCIAVQDSFGNPPRGRSAQLQLVKRWIDAAVVLGAPIVEVIAGWRPPGESEAQTWDAVVECLREVGHYARDADVVVALQNHNHLALTRTGADLLRMLDEVGAGLLGHVLDTGQYAGSPGATGGTADSGGDFYASISATAPRADLVRAKVFTGGSRETGLADAELDYDRIFTILRSAGFDGVVSLVHWGLAAEAEGIRSGARVLRHHVPVVG